jgi:hypothetical protein
MPQSYCYISDNIQINQSLTNDEVDPFLSLFTILILQTYRPPRHFLIFLAQGNVIGLYTSREVMKYLSVYYAAF